MQETNSSNIGLVLLAAGFGTRFGGDKQLSIVGPKDAIIMDYTIYDAWRIGYSWVMIILREEIVSKFEGEVGRRWRDKIELRYSIQRHDTYVPDNYLPQITQRQKLWGTGHALLSASKQITGPFAVANADDFYGYNSLQKIFTYLLNHAAIAEPNQIKPAPLPLTMVGFQLGLTLSENGSVSRGICHTYTDSNGMEWLSNIQEHTQLVRKKDYKIYSILEDSTLLLAEDTPVSMNLFGLYPNIFQHLQQQFANFLESLAALWQQENQEKALKQEFHLPATVEAMREQNQAIIAILHSPDPWFGLTYQEDLPIVRQKIQTLTDMGKYPADLFVRKNQAAKRSLTYKNGPLAALAT